MDAAAMDRMAKHYWAMWGAAGVRSGWPVAHGGGGEPSWEEQAFARDAAGHLGGCVWPPRSYTCSFCRREFRSAQALGGHMNVHRRDRARLRQGASSPDHDDPLQLQQPISLCGPPPPPPPDQLLHQPAVQRALPRRLSSPKSITGDRGLQATMAATASDVNYSCIATIIKESKNKALFISMPATAATARESSSTFLGGAGDNGDDDDDEGVKEIRRKRRRVDLERGVPVHDHDPAGAKVTMVASPSSSSSPLLVHHHHHHHELVDERQELDLELRLGTSPA